MNDLVGRSIESVHTMSVITHLPVTTTTIIIMRIILLRISKLRLILLLRLSIFYGCSVGIVGAGVVVVCGIYTNLETSNAGQA